MKLVIESRDPFRFRKELNTDNERVCYITNNSKRIIIHDLNTTNNSSVNFDFFFFHKNDYKINERYSLLLTQRTQSFDAHVYYKALEKISSSDSDDLFSGRQPGNLNNNITASNNNITVGYFEVAHVSTKRVFFNYSDFYDDNEVNYIEKCRLSAPAIISNDPFDPNPQSPLLFSLDAGNIYYQDAIDADGPFFLTSKGCGDCREYGDKEKPNFWID